MPKSMLPDSSGNNRKAMCMPSKWRNLSAKSELCIFDMHSFFLTCYVPEGFEKLVIDYMHMEHGCSENAIGVSI